MLKKIWPKIKGRKVWFLLLLVLVVIVYLFSGSKNQDVLETYRVNVGEIIEGVSVTGNVRAKSDVSLAFERGGKVATISVNVGDRVYSGQVLATLSSADLLANLEQARANLKKAELVMGNNYDQAKLNLDQDRASLSNSIKDSYTKSDDALRNKVYSLFVDPQRYNAKLSFVTDANLKESIEKSRNVMTDLFDQWQRDLSVWNGESELRQNFEVARNNLNQLKIMLDDCASAVNGLTIDSTVTQSDIDTWKLNISTARSNINSAINSLTDAWGAYDTALLGLEIAKGDTLVEQASIDQARAEVASAEAELNKAVIKSPINGVVTDLPIKLGEIVSTNQVVVRVISFGEYEIETFIPEADIAKIQIGNRAAATLDAYGPEIKFDSKIIKVDPAATVVDGVPTYKTTLRFDNQDDRIKAGMTANLEIITAERLGVIVVPSQAIISRPDGRYVRVLLSDNQVVQRKVEVGLRGYDGKTEIVSGLEVGEIVVTK